ncbi:hypothetical protein EVJ58_g2875 [Rhodofomes roseus]|uniref:Uncharacterized protein n=1 Tax=Rhodofomes roseus TaxID=34475 RepID=A0A4Y9YNN3_9APHY|nr:hypothetical protein EVJ58_g2875 [Rhodofomes roseus]
MGMADGDDLRDGDRVRRCAEGPHARLEHSHRRDATLRAILPDVPTHAVPHFIIHVYAVLRRKRVTVSFIVDVCAMWLPAIPPPSLSSPASSRTMHSAFDHVALPLDEFADFAAFMASMTMDTPTLRSRVMTSTICQTLSMSRYVTMHIPTSAVTDASLPQMLHMREALFFRDVVESVVTVPSFEEAVGTDDSSSSAGAPPDLIAPRPRRIALPPFLLRSVFHLHSAPAEPQARTVDPRPRPPRASADLPAPAELQARPHCRLRRRLRC